MLHTNPTFRNEMKATENERFRNAHQRSLRKEREEAMQQDNEAPVPQHTFYVIKRVNDELLYAQNNEDEVTWTKRKLEADHFAGNLATVIAHQNEAQLEVV